MSWELEEAITYYQRQGAPRDQGAVINLLTEVQQENGGSIPRSAVTAIAAQYKTPESYFLAIIRRIPRLRLLDRHILELCAGPNCGRHTALAAYAESLKCKNITVKFVPCMRLCGKGPNIRWDGTLYHKADEALLKRLTENISPESN